MTIADLLTLVTGIALATEHHPDPAADATRLLDLTVAGSAREWIGERRWLVVTAEPQLPPPRRARIGGPASTSRSGSQLPRRTRPAALTV